MALDNPAQNNRPSKLTTGLRPPALRVVPMSEIAGDGEEDTALLRGMAEEAIGYLESLPWCEEIGDAYFGAGVGGIIATFLFYVAVDHYEQGQWLWIFVGDIPSSYMRVGDCTTPKPATERYVKGLEEWVEYANKGLSSTDLIPIDCSPTAESASMLRSRIELLRGEILPSIFD